MGSIEFKNIVKTENIVNAINYLSMTCYSNPLDIRDIYARFIVKWQNSAADWNTQSDVDNKRQS